MSPGDQSRGHRFASWVFLLAGLTGLAILAPALFLEQQMGASAPPSINHPEFYYGFLGSALVWQLLFLLISRDPVRWRPLMPIAALEKAAFFGACLALYSTGRLAPTGVFFGSLIDGVWMLLFAIAWRVTRPVAWT